MAGYACRIRCLGIVTRSAGLHIPPRQLRVQTSPTSHTDRHKSSLLMRCRLETELIDVSARGVTRCTELLLTVARLAVGDLPLCSNTVRETEIQIVHFEERL